MTALTPARAFASTNSTPAIPTSQRSIGELGRNCWLRRSSFADTWNELPSVGAHSPTVAKCPRTHFIAEDGSDITMSELFGDKDTLVIYSYMLGPQRETPCPMCTSMMGGFTSKIPDIRRRRRRLHRPLVH